MDSTQLSSLNFDKLKFNHSPDGVFYVDYLRRKIDSELTRFSAIPLVWIKIVPIKVITFIWRACLDRIPIALPLGPKVCI